MKIKNRLENDYIKVLQYVDSHQKGIYTLEYGLRKIKCNYVTMFESNNCLEFKDKNYDEYFAIVFHSIEDDVDFELRYDYLPLTIYHEGIKIFDLKGFKK